MRKFFAVLVAIFFFPIFGFCQSNESHPLTLFDCYKLALKQSELIAVDAEKIKEAQTHFIQALGTILPQVSFNRTETRQGSKITPSSNKYYEQSFSFSQELFSGFKEFAAINAGKYEKSQREKEKLRAEQLLFTDVSDAFYLLIEIREDLKILEAIRKSFEDRIEELKNRVDLGKSRTSEVVSTQTQLYSLEDQIESASGEEKISRELLEFLTGMPINEITDTQTQINLESESTYLAKAAMRADVEAANMAWKVDKESVVIAKSGFFPTINAEGDYFTHRNSAPKDSNWDAFLKINIPIFEGTTTYGNVKEARAIAMESELLFQRAGRIAVQEIKDAYVNVQSALTRMAVLKKAFESAEMNYELQSKDYKLNVVNNLDVLTGIQSLEDVHRNYSRITYETKRFYWKLQVAAGAIDVEKLR